jgi:hypothetical protein
MDDMKPHSNREERMSAAWLTAIDVTGENGAERLALFSGNDDRLSAGFMPTPLFPIRR